jgi:hypothetical protein
MGATAVTQKPPRPPEEAEKQRFLKLRVLLVKVSVKLKAARRSSQQ